MTISNQLSGWYMSIQARTSKVTSVIKVVIGVIGNATCIGTKFPMYRAQITRNTVHHLRNFPDGKMVTGMKKYL